MTSEQRLKELPKAIVKWYEIEKGSRAACVVWGCGNSRLTAEALKEMGVWTDLIPLEEIDRRQNEEGGREGGSCADAASTGGKADRRETGQGKYDIIVAVDVIEYMSHAEEGLRRLRTMLKPEGKLLLAADNRLGIRYFCGDQDAFSGKNYDGIENYRHLHSWERKTMEGRAYSKRELTGFLEKAGFGGHRFYSVFPKTSNPQLLLAEDYEPNEALDIRVFPEYNNPGTVFLMEEELYPTLMENGMLHAMANGFFIECPLDGVYAPVSQVTLSGERGTDDAMATIVRRDGLVEKRALYGPGRRKLGQMLENHRYLSSRGVRMVDAEMRGDALVMPYMAGVPANDYFRRLLKEDALSFLCQLDGFWDTILHSSDQASYDEIDWERFEPGWEERKGDDPNRDKWKRIATGTEEEKEALGVILKRGYLDMVSLNCFHINGEFVFYDQELYLENVPAKAILLRTIEFIYKFHDDLNLILPRKELMERYGLREHKDLFGKFTGRFLNELRHDDGLSDYFREGRRERGAVMENRKRMNYSEEEYGLIFKDIFHHAQGRRLYLFGSGKYARRFREKYEHAYPAAGYLDNDRSRWGTMTDGLMVHSPDMLKGMNPAEYKVMVCIRDYAPVVRQLRKAGIPNFSVYDPNMAYREDQYLRRPWGESRNLEGRAPQGEEGGVKKYHVGYVAGVFDLFHIGHLNLLRRAKEQCGYLIVGVVTDEGVIKHKKSRPRIPFEERLAIVGACKYVDEAVEIPVDQGDTDEAYRRYRFDVQFSGSDYAVDPKWMAKREFLQRHGADLVFFPYTEGVSTTQLKGIVAQDEKADIDQAAQNKNNAK